MTEFVRVRQFDSEEGGGAGKFCQADYLFSAKHRLRIQNILKSIFKSQKKQPYMEGRGGGVVVQDTIGCFMLVCVIFIKFLFICFLCLCPRHKMARGH